MNGQEKIAKSQAKNIVNEFKETLDLKELESSIYEEIKEALKSKQSELLRCCKLALKHGRWDDYSAGTTYHQIEEAIKKAEL